MISNAGEFRQQLLIVLLELSDKVKKVANAAAPGQRTFRQISGVGVDKRSLSLRGEGSFLCLCFQRAVKALKISYPATGEEDDLVASDEWAWTDPEAAKKCRVST